MPFAEARRQKIFQPRAEQFAQEFADFRGKRIGDVGAGFGLFLEELLKIWPDADAYAIEPSVDMAGICRDKGIRVIQKMFEDLDSADGKFDLLCSFELFEHLNNPSKFLKKVNETLNPGGYLLLTTLNGKGFDIQMLWEKHKTVMPPQHLNFINPEAMKIALKDCGFETVSITTPGKLDWDITERMIRDEKVDLGRFWDLICDADEKTKESLQQWITENNLSSHIRVVAKKVKELQEV